MGDWDQMGLNAGAWFVIHTKSNQERIAKESLEAEGLEVYYPQVKTTVHHARSIKVVKRPFFPRYIFVSRGGGGAGGYRSIKTANGVSSVLRFGDEWVTVQQGVVDSIREREVGGFIRLELKPVEVCAYKPGQTLKVTSGAYSGLQAIFQSTCGKERARVLVSLFGTLTRAELSLVDLAGV